MCDPVIDEHFRRSLGERYTHLFASSPSSTSSTSNPATTNDSSSRDANKMPSTVNVTGLSGIFWLTITHTHTHLLIFLIIGKTKQWTIILPRHLEKLGSNCRVKPRKKRLTQTHNQDHQYHRRLRDKDFCWLETQYPIIIIINSVGVRQKKINN